MVLTRSVPLSMLMWQSVPLPFRRPSALVRSCILMTVVDACISPTTGTLAELVIRWTKTQRPSNVPPAAAVEEGRETAAASTAALPIEQMLSGRLQIMHYS